VVPFLFLDLSVFVIPRTAMRDINRLFLIEKDDLSLTRKIRPAWLFFLGGCCRFMALRRLT
jgi:hypothetical protein